MEQLDLLSKPQPQTATFAETLARVRDLARCCVLATDPDAALAALAAVPPITGAEGLYKFLGSCTTFAEVRTMEGALTTLAAARAGACQVVLDDMEPHARELVQMLVAERGDDETPIAALVDERIAAGKA